MSGKKPELNKKFSEDDDSEQQEQQENEQSGPQDEQEQHEIISSNESSSSTNKQIEEEYSTLDELIAKLNDDDHSEDEGIEDYKLGGYHPCHIGEVLSNRYVLIQKLGWGHFSTVWLAKDFKYSTYVAIKIMKSAPHYLEASYDEIQILQKVAKNAFNPEWIQSLKQYEKGKTHFDRDDCHVLNLLNAFLYKGPYGNHFCMVFQILGINLWEILKKYDCKGLPVNIVKQITRQVLMGLDFLNRICKVIHTDLKPENVLVCLTEKQLKKIVQDEQLSVQGDFNQRLHYYCEKYNLGPQTQHHPVVVDSSDSSEDDDFEGLEDESEVVVAYSLKIKELNQKLLSESITKNCKRTIKKKIKKYEDQREKELEALEERNRIKIQANKKQKQNKPKPQKKTFKDLFQDFKHKISFDNVEGGLSQGFKVKIADLGNACWQHHHFATQIQTRQYRSPEVLLGSKYNLSADMWSLACMTFELLTGQLLFNPKKDPNDQFGKNDDHLAQIMELMGRLPKKMSMRGEKAKKYISSEGKLKRIPKLQNWTIKDLMIAKFRYKQDEAQFLQSFLQPMLNCYPQKRIMSRQMLKNKWLYTNCPEEYLMDHETHQRLRIQKYDVEIQRDQVYQYESQMEDASSEEGGEEQQELYDNQKRGDIRQIDRSFTDLGYIGYGTGIFLQKLDFGPNWQFS